jgi:hypothetical protein
LERALRQILKGDPQGRSLREILWGNPLRRSLGLRGDPVGRSLRETGRSLRELLWGNPLRRSQGEILREGPDTGCQDCAVKASSRVSLVAKHSLPCPGVLVSK